MGGVIGGIGEEIMDSIGFCCGARMEPPEEGIAANEKLNPTHIPAKPKQIVCPRCKAKFYDYDGLGLIGSSGGCVSR